MWGDGFTRQHTRRRQRSPAQGRQPVSQSASGGQAASTPGRQHTGRHLSTHNPSSRPMTATQRLDVRVCRWLMQDNLLLCLPGVLVLC